MLFALLATITASNASRARQPMRPTVKLATQPLPHDSLNAAFELITTEAAFKALEAEWNDLWERSVEKRFTQSFSWRWVGWRTTGRARARELKILIMRVAGQAVLIWPLAVRRRYKLWREAIALGPEYTDYHPIVVADTPMADQYMTAAANHLSGLRVADAIRAPFLNAEQAPSVVPRSGPRRLSLETLPSPRISFAGFPSWEAYWNSRSKNMKSNVKRRSRRLAELGEVTFERITDRAQFERLLDWTMRRKIEWMRRNGLDNDYIRAPEFTHFLSSIGDDIYPAGRWTMHALKLNGRVIATEMGTMDSRRFESFMGAQDDTHSTLSPGVLLQVRILEQTFAAGLEYDFRIGAESYKSAWATHDAPVTSITFSTGAWGAIYMDLRTLKERVSVLKDRARLAIPAQWRQNVKSVIAAARGLGRGRAYDLAAGLSAAEAGGGGAEFEVSGAGAAPLRFRLDC